MPQALPARPHLDWYRKSAKKKLKQLREQSPRAKLADAQRAVAREHGFASWPKLKAQIELIRASLSSAAPDAQQVTGFFAALKRGDARTVRGMLRESPALANSRQNETTPLHEAAEAHQTEIIKILLDAGADPHALYGQSAHSPLSWALTVGAIDAAKALTNVVRPDFFCAAGLGDLKAVKSFFDNDGKLAPNPSQTGSSRWSADGQRLPRPPQTDVELISDALYIAARNGQTQVARFLIDRGADLSFRGFLRGTPLHWAWYSGSRKTIDLLLRAGADPTLRDSEFNCTPRAFGICVVSNWGIERKARLLLKQDPSLARIFEGRATPLHEAARNGHVEIVRMLLKAGADPHARDVDGKTAAELARAAGHESLAKLLEGRAEPGPSA